MEIPTSLLYTKEHEWIKVDGDIATIGITAFAQGELGDIVFIEVETVEDELEKTDAFGTIEAVKTVSDMYMPISGEVLEFNETLSDEPELVNKDPYNDGWIIKVKIANKDELSELLSPEQYKAEIE